MECVYDLAFRKFKPEESAFRMDLLELFPTACANVLASPSLDRYPAQKRAAASMCEIVTSHSVWLFTKANTPRGRDERVWKVRAAVDVTLLLAGAAS